jgi:hypothetical protein
VAHASVADAKRGYELVSSPNAGVVEPDWFVPLGRWASPIAQGGRVLARTNTPIPEAMSQPTGSTYLSSRGADGWRVQPVEVPQSTFVQSIAVPTSATPDLATIVLTLGGIRPRPGQVLTPDAVLMPDGIPYGFRRLWRASDGSSSWLTPPSVERDVAFEADPQSDSGQVHLSVDGASVVFNDSGKLVPGISGPSDVARAYRRTAAGLELLSREPDGTPTERSARFSVASDDNGVVALRTSDAQGQAEILVSSAGGTKVASRPRGTVGPTPLNASFGDAILTPDGRTLLFVTNIPLLSADTDQSFDLYRYDVATDGLALVSAAAHGAIGSGDDCGGIFTGSACDISTPMVGRDGTAYFFAPEQLDGGKGEPGVVGLYRAGSDGTPQFIASIPNPDGWMFNPDGGDRVKFQVADNGDLVFESKDSLDQLQSGTRTQVWRVGHESDHVQCLTCRANRSTPSGSSYLSYDHSEGDERGTSFFRVVQPDGGNGGAARVTADGRTVFVTSYDRLSPGDTNAAADVYAIDVPTGVAHLITTGVGTRDNYLLGTDGDGSNVYFSTTDSLDPHDHNGGAAKLYDARIGGGYVSAAPQASACVAAACRAVAPTLAPFAPPATGAVVADASSPPADDEPEIGTISKSARAKLGRTGRLAVKVSGVTARSSVVFTVTVVLGGSVSGKRTVTARAVSSAGGTARSATVSFSATDRRRIATAVRKRSLAVSVRVDAGTDQHPTLAATITRKGK